MSKTASLLENNSRTRQVIKDVRKKFLGQVIAIEYRLGTDRSGDPAIFFHVILNDAAAKNREQLADITGRLSRDLFDQLDLGHTDYTPYFDFLSESEARALAKHG